MAAFVVVYFCRRFHWFMFARLNVCFAFRWIYGHSAVKLTAIFSSKKKKKNPKNKKKFVPIRSVIVCQSTSTRVRFFCVLSARLRVNGAPRLIDWFTLEISFSSSTKIWFKKKKIRWFFFIIEKLWIWWILSGNRYKFLWNEMKWLVDQRWTFGLFIS